MGKPRVLLVDDSPTVRAVLRAQLPARDFEVVEAVDGDEALHIARDAEPDVVLLDVEMPGRDGLAVMKELRGDPALNTVPVIFLTGRVAAADVVAGLDLGAHDYLRKPVEASELLARVRAALRMKELQDELLRRNEMLEHTACTDPLTGLYNRRFAGEELIKFCSRSKRHGTQLSIALLDVDDFKRVNDAHGHAAGDEVLVELARRLARRLRREDVLGRWGGEEFIVLMPDTGLEGARQAADALRLAVAETRFQCASTELEMTISAGVADFREDRPEDIVKRADAALYAAKTAGRNQVRS